MDRTRVDELTAFITAYEAATNSHDVGRILRLVDPSATYWFTDGAHTGHHEIGVALTKTFATIRDESYRIHHVEWISISADAATFRYRFEWHGTIDGEQRSGAGRGTNAVHRTADGWRILHEHLST